MGKLKTELKKAENKMKEIDDKVHGLENEISLKADKDKLELKNELKLRELQLRIRGLEEEEGEDIRDKVVDILAELLEINSEELDKMLDYVFRLRSFYANKNKVPRNVLVNVTSKKLKDQMIQQSLQNPIELGGGGES